MRRRNTAAAVATLVVAAAAALAAFGSTDSRPATAESDDASALAAEGIAFVDKARTESDPTNYPRADDALNRSLQLRPDGNWEALAGKAALAAGRHDFAGALAFAEQAKGLNPTNPFIRGVLVDALTELGRYAEAVEAAQQMVDLKPNFSSFARVSYLRELHGDVDGALAAMADALQSASAPGDRAFAAYYLGEIEWSRGDVDAAERHYRFALRADPTATNAQAGLARVAAARGDLAGAVVGFEKVVAAFPDPEVLKELAELSTATGRPDLAEERLAAAERSNADQAANGVDVNLETALFSADLRRELARGLAAAEDEWRRRQSVHVADALAWQLHAHGRDEEALEYTDRALALGTRSALFRFHRAEILWALGRTSEARADYATALAINPNFSFVYRATALARAESVR